MADLPESRVSPDKPPFSSVGVDYFGPFQVRRGRSLLKRYGVIFTCLAIRAVHIEIAHSLDADSFLLALQRFIARRGQVRYTQTTGHTSPAASVSYVMPYWSGIKKRYTTLLCRRTSSGRSVLRTVLTLGAFGRGALEPFGKSLNLC